MWTPDPGALAGFGLVPDAPANRGLLDQVAALEWVREEVAALGGDPARVTVFGQSAGAGSVAALLAVPRAQGLFRRAIASSVQGTLLTPAFAEDVARACAAELGIGPEALGDVDPWLLPLAVDAVAARVEEYVVRWGLAAHAPVLLVPVVDGEVLPTTPWRGLTGEVDLLVGHTRDEQRLLSALSGRLGTITAREADLTPALFAPDPAAYRAAHPGPDERYEVVRSDWLFRMPSVLLARAQLAAGGRAHVYELTWPAPGGGGGLGACHGLDVPLVFGTLAAGELAGFRHPEGAPLRRAAVGRRLSGAGVAGPLDGPAGGPRPGAVRRQAQPADGGATSPRVTSPAETGRSAYLAPWRARGRPGVSAAICSCSATIPARRASGRGGQPGT